jgi:hypothetical protein
MADKQLRLETHTHCLLPVMPYTSYLADCRLLGISTCPL